MNIGYKMKRTKEGFVHLRMPLCYHCIVIFSKGAFGE